MSIHTAHTDFIYDTVPAMTVSDLDIPERLETDISVQTYDIRPGDQFLIFSADRSVCGHFQVNRWINTIPAQVQLDNVQSNTPLFVTCGQLARLEKRNSLRPVAMSGSETRKDNFLRSQLALSDEEYARAARRYGYVQAAENAFDQHNEGRSNRKLLSRAIADHAEATGDQLPSVSSVYVWIKLVRENQQFNPILALADKPRPGNPYQRFSPRVEEAISKALLVAMRQPKGTWKSAKATLHHLGQSDYPDMQNLVSDSGSSRRIIADRTIQKRWQYVSEYEKDLERLGEDYAMRRHKRYILQNRAERPLEIVDVDHTQADIFVVDDRYPLHHARPDIIAFRDRATGIVLGFAVTFQSPSVESFMVGLQHAMMPKDPAELPKGVNYPWFGRFNRLGVDNATHFIGDDVRHAARDLGFQIVEYRPGQPWLKGAMEKLFDILNNGIIHNLPGSTMNSSAELEKFDDPKEQTRPVLTLGQLEAFLYQEIANNYHQRPHQGLGPLATLKGIPALLWDREIKKAPQRRPIDPELFVSHAGKTEMRTIQPEGIVWKHLVYQSAELFALVNHPKTLLGSGKHTGTQFRVIRNPADMSRIWVHDPYSDRMIAVPIASSMENYTKGLREYQHDRIIEHVRKKLKADVDEKSLLEAQAAFAKFLHDRHIRDGLARSKTQLTKFFSGQKQALARSRAIPMPTVSPNGRLLLASSVGEVEDDNEQLAVVGKTPADPTEQQRDQHTDLSENDSYDLNGWENM